MPVRGTGVLDGLLSLLYPPVCTACGVDIPVEKTGAVMCETCLSRLLSLDLSSCPRCASPLEADKQCTFCYRLEPALDLVRSGYWFSGPVPSLMHAFKYRGTWSLAVALAELTVSLETCAQAIEGVEILAPVPLHPWRRIRRGYNQSESLASGLADLSGRRFEPRLLARERRTRTQTRLNPEERKKNVEGAFKVRDRTLVEGRTICIIDDVMTTGATAGACAAALKDAGAVRVTALTFARA